MSATRFQQELETERGLLRSVYTNTWPRGSSVNYRGHIIQKEHADDGLNGAWRIRTSDGRFIATVELSEFDSANEWVRYVDAVIHTGAEQASQWFSLPYGKQPKGDGC